MGPTLVHAHRKHTQVVIWLPVKIFLAGEQTDCIDENVLSFMTVIFLIVSQ